MPHDHKQEFDIVRVTIAIVVAFALLYFFAGNAAEKYKSPYYDRQDQTPTHSKLINK